MRRCFKIIKKKTTIGIDANEANVKNRVGSGAYATNLLKEFAKNKEYQFKIFLKKRPLSDLPKEGKNFKYNIFGPNKFWTQFALPIKLNFRSNIDIFFTLGHYGPRFSRIPFAITIFDLSYLHYPQMFKKNDLYQLTNWSKYSIENSKHIFTISKSSKSDIVKNYNIDPSKITVTYPGYDQIRFKPQPTSKIKKIKSKYKIKGDYLIFVGTLQPRKNIEKLIEAFNQAIRRTKPENQMTRLPEDLQLVIAGKKGWLYDPIFSKVGKLKLNQHIIFTDYIIDADLPPLLAGAKAYVLPSLWEGFGIPVIEAQACGVPVVVSNTSSLPEIISSSSVILSEAKDLSSSAIVAGSGVLVNPKSVASIADGIKKVLSDEKLRQDLIKKGLANIKRFSWQKCASQTLAVLEKLASDKTP